MDKRDDSKVSFGRRRCLQAGMSIAPWLAFSASCQPAAAPIPEQEESDESPFPPAETPPPQAPRDVFVEHAYAEQQVDLGEVTMNYAVAGSDTSPAVLLIPGQTESWWGYEAAMMSLEKRFQVYAVDLRGQGRSSWTPGRYTFDNLGNDLVRFIERVVRRPVIVAGNSSGGLLACWLSAYAAPGQVRAALLEDPPLWASLIDPLYPPSLADTLGPVFELLSDYLGDQWSVDDWEGLRQAAKEDSRPIVGAAVSKGDEPPQNIKEFDPEWARTFVEGTMQQTCRHEEMLAAVKTPLLLTHHLRLTLPSGEFLGAYSDEQASKAREILETTGIAFEYQSFPDATHAMHNADPERYVGALVEWAETLSA